MSFTAGTRPGPYKIPSAIAASGPVPLWQTTAGALTDSATGRRGRLLAVWLLVIVASFVPQADASTIDSMVVAQDFACALRADRTIVCWGSGSAATGWPAGAFAQIDGSRWHGCGVRTEGTLACWGRNDYGQATPPGGTFAQVSTGAYYSCAVRGDGTVACWGRNSYGEASPPAGTFSQVSAGSWYACALRTDGTIACWGRSEYGETTPPSGSFAFVTAGGSHACALRTDGTVTCWGGGPTPAATPAGLFSQIETGGGHACGVRVDGAAVCWGQNEFGQSAAPADTFRRVDAGYGVSCGTKSDGSAVCWGTYAGLRVAIGSPRTQTAGVAFTEPLGASGGGGGPYTFELLTGTQPAGVTLSASGTISGTTLEIGSFPVTVRATDVNGVAGDSALVLAVVPPSPQNVLTTPPATLTGEGADHRFGLSVATAGDVNGDGYADVLVGACAYSSNTGRAYLYLGRASGLATIAAATLTGEGTNDGFGCSVARAGDVNGDGYADVIVGASGYNNSTGRAYMYLGGPSGLTTTPATVLTGETTGDRFGNSVATAGDINGDGYADVIVGASGSNNSTGRAYVYLGGPSGLATTPATTLAGETTGGFFGFSVAAAGDVNGDAHADVVVGAYAYSGDTGRAYVYLGGPSGLATTPAATLTGEGTGHRFGCAVASAGDVNGDGYADVVVGAYAYSSYTGRVYVYLGGASGLAATPAATLTGAATNDDFGLSVATAGDVNGDGYADVIVGAEGYPGFTGRACLYLGGASGLATTPATTLTGEATTSRFGSSVATAGDVNGDGYADVVVGAYGYSSQTGRTYVYEGGASLGASAIVSMVVAQDFACALRADRTIVCWGSGDAAAGWPAGAFAQIDGSRWHGCGVRTDGALACWGRNDWGQATPPAGTFLQVSTGAYYSCAVRGDGTVACWGRNSYGEASPPAGTFSQVSAGSWYACALRPDGTIACWGRNEYGITIPPTGSFSFVTAGGAHACALRTDGTVTCWGAGPTPAATPSGLFSQIETGGGHACGVRPDGTIVCWGQNEFGQSAAPADTFRRVDAGYGVSCGTKSDGSAVCWGTYLGLRVAIASPPIYTAGVAFTDTLGASGGGGGPYTFGLLTGRLPAGVALSSGGTLSGTPLEIGRFPITVRVTDVNGVAGDTALVLEVVVPKLPATITGRVTSASTGAPVANASVYAYTSTGAVAGNVNTNALGGYNLGLPPGSYFLAATSAGYVGQLFNDLPCPFLSCSVWAGTPVVVTEPTTTWGINFALAPGGAITGTVSDGNTGAPLVNAAVYTYTGTGALAASVNTNAQGIYTVTGLATGPYYLSTAPGGYTGELYNDLPCPFLACNVTTGTAVWVTAPNTISSIDFALSRSVTTAPPFGQVDTPAQNAAGIVGAIGVTGWALDDAGVTGVRIYRNCTPFENQANCQTVDGHSVVFIGNAAFLAGARPDVEAAFRGYPRAYRAGWGYLMLTNMLPHVPNAQVSGGQGAITLYAFALDQDGHRTLLGRSRLDHTPTTITLENATIAKPFGALDTPGQGQSVSGVVPNFGWALTPDTNNGADAGDILIPTGGSTMKVVIDGVAVGNVTYNQCRGTIGNPVPSGSYCDDDVANIFGNPSPQPTSTPRGTNPTKYRNLDHGRGAIGSFDIDTRRLSDGLHTIAWGVTDSAGRPEGIGSRFFTVLNSPAADTSGAGSDPRAGADAATPLRDAPAAVRGDARVLGVLTPSPAEVLVRTGFDWHAPLELVAAGADGVRRVQIPEFGRLEVQLGPVEVGYLVANGTLRDLPPGSHLDATTGSFAWLPGAGYVGTYNLAFVRGGEQVRVAVTIRPRTPTAPGESEVRMWVDLPRDAKSVPGTFAVAGWALDPQAAFGSGIGAVHVWAQRRDVAGSLPIFLGSAELGGHRPDVGVAFGAQFDRVGYDLVAAGLAPGPYDITVYAWNRRTARWEDARTVTVLVR